MNAVVIPAIVIKDAERKIMASDAIEPITFASLELKESDIEEFVCKGIGDRPRFVLQGRQKTSTSLLMPRRSRLIILDVPLRE